MIKKVGLIGLGAVVLVAAAFFVLRATSHATDFCPMAHKVDHNWYCKVMDQREPEFLVVHFNQKTSEVRLAVHVPGTMVRWLKPPFVSATGFSEIRKKEIKFGPVGALIDGQSYPMSVESLNHNEGLF